MHSNHLRTPKGNKKRRNLLIWLSSSLVTSFFIGLVLFSTFRPDPLISFVDINEGFYVLEEGQSTEVFFRASDELGSFIYVSYDPRVVRFVENRLIAVGPGTTTIMVSNTSNPRAFDTATVTVRQGVVSPIEPEPKPEPEAPVNPVNPDDSDDEGVITPPTIYTVTITNETGAVITTLAVEEGSSITTSSLDLPETFKGFFLEGETCEHEPFNLETPISENLTLIQASFNDQAPCLQLDYIVLSGRPVEGTKLKVDIFPIGANVTISWYTSVNNRTYREISGENESTYTIRPEDSGKFIRVYVVSDSNLPVVRFDTIKLDVFGTVNNSGTTDNPPSQSIQALIDQGFIPISSPEDLLAIQTTNPHLFAGVLLTEGGLSKSYALVNHLDLSSYTNLTQGFITGVFSGTLDGNGYTISGLAINSNQSNLALFGQVSGASIERLTIHNFNISGSLTSSNNVGGLIGEVIGGANTFTEITITQSSVQGRFFIGILIGGISTGSVVNISEINFSGEVTGQQQVGGLVGNIFSSQMTIDQVQGTLYVSNSGLDIVGGLVGNINSSSVNISNVFFMAEMRVRTDVGGLIGQSTNSQITLSSVTNHVEISGINNLGGLIGRSNTSQISISKVNAQVEVVGANNVGGFFGESNGNLNLIISESYLTGTNQGAHRIGGFIGYAFGSTSILIKDSYNLSLVSGSGSDIGGFIGAVVGNPSHLYILNSYNAGIVNGTIGASIIGLLDTVIVTFSAVYALDGSSLNNVTIGSINNHVDTTGNILPISVFDMTTLSTFTNANWDITNHPDLSTTWAIGFNGITTYPWLSWQNQPDQDQIINPYIATGYIPVTSIEDLRAIESETSHTFAGGTPYAFVTNGGLHKNYILLNDINLSGTTYTTSLINGNFTGEFEGNNYRIFNLTINASSDFIGMFSGLANEATVKNVTLEAIHINTSNQKNSYGVLAGRINGNNVLITNILVTGSTVEANNQVGGLIGFISDSSNVTFSQITQHVDVTSQGFHAGGVVAEIHNSQVTFHNIVRFGTVHAGSNHAGGILGIGTASVITLSSIAHYGDVTADGVDAGGLIGQLRENSHAYILNAFNTGVITNTNTNGTNVDFGQAGGLIGRIGQSGSTATARIENAYNTGLVTSGTINKGSIVGEVEASGSSAEFIRVYALNIPSGLGTIGATEAGVTITGNVSSLGIPQMAALRTFDGWDIERYPTSSAIWAIQFNNQTTYPWLSFSNQPQSSQIISTTPIYSGSDLKTIEDNLFGHFILENDIDLSPYTNLTRSFIDGTFSGNLYGQGFTISGLAINASVSRIGLFSRLSGANIDDIVIKNFNITGAQIIGLLAGEIVSPEATYISNILITNSSLHSSTSSEDSYVGSLIGSIINSNSYISNVHSNGSVNALKNFSGGIIGIINGSNVEINQTTFSGIISGRQRVGGIIGLVTNVSNVTLQSITIPVGASITTTGSEVGGIFGDVFSGARAIIGSNLSVQGTISGNGTNEGAIIGRYAQGTGNNSFININGIDANYTGVPTRLIGNLTSPTKTDTAINIVAIPN